MKGTIYILITLLLLSQVIATDYNRAMPEEAITNERFEITHHFTDLDTTKGELISVREIFPENVKLVDWHIVGANTKDSFQSSFLNTVSGDTTHGWDIPVKETYMTLSISVVSEINGLFPLESVVTYPPNKVTRETNNLRVITVEGETITGDAPLCFDGTFQFLECWDDNTAYTYKCEEGYWVGTGEECTIPECAEDEILDCGENLFIVKRACVDNIYKSENEQVCPLLDLNTNSKVIRTAMLAALLVLILGLYLYNKGFHKGEESTTKDESEPEIPAD